MMKAHEVALRLSNQRGVLVIKTRAMSKYRQVDGEDVTRGGAVAQADSMPSGKKERKKGERGVALPGGE